MVTTQKELIVEIYGKVTAIEEHLKNLNGSVKKQEARICKNEKQILTVEKKQDTLNTWYRVKSWVLAGSFSIISVLITVLVYGIL